MQRGQGSALGGRGGVKPFCFFRREGQDYFASTEIFQEDRMYVLEGVANWKSFKKDKCRKM